jgi:hypothetical protein
MNNIDRKVLGKKNKEDNCFRHHKRLLDSATREASIAWGSEDQLWEMRTRLSWQQLAWTSKAGEQKSAMLKMEAGDPQTEAIETRATKSHGRINRHL